MLHAARIASVFACALAASTALGQGLGGAAPQIRSEQVGEGLYVLFGPGSGNVLVSIGASGVLAVDDGVGLAGPGGGRGQGDQQSHRGKGYGESFLHAPIVGMDGSLARPRQSGQRV